MAETLVPPNMLAELRVEGRDGDVSTSSACSSCRCSSGVLSGSDCGSLQIVCCKIDHCHL